MAWPLTMFSFIGFSDISSWLDVWLKEHGFCHPTEPGSRTLQDTCHSVLILSAFALKATIEICSLSLPTLPRWATSLRSGYEPFWLRFFSKAQNNQSPDWILSLGITHFCSLGKNNLKIRILGVSNENFTLALAGKIVFWSTDVSTPPGAIVKVFTEIGGRCLS